MASAAITQKEEMDIARTRVVTLISTAHRGGAPGKNLGQRWLQFVEAANTGTASAAEDAYIKFLVALEDMQLLGRKLAASQAVHKREQESYERKQQELAANVAQANARIEEKKQELAAARLWRQQQEEYELLRKQIMEVAPRHETQRQLDEVNRQIDGIRGDIQRQDRLYQVIAKKCAAVRYQLEDLLASFPRADGAAADGPAEPAAMQVDG